MGTDYIPVAYRESGKALKKPDSKKRKDANWDRYGNRRFAVRFKSYSLKQHGIQRAKPPVNYFEEVDCRTKAPYLIGIELEVENFHTENQHEGLNNLLQEHLNGSHYCCSDGSLQRGVEIVTAPRSPTEIRANYANYYQLLKGISKLGMTAHDNGNCGLHFHVNRGCLADATWLKLSRFLVKHKELFMTLSRRNGYSYCQFKTSTSERYCALNLCNSNTVEFRFFRGTLFPDSFFAAYETIESLLELFKKFKQPTITQWVKLMSANKYKKLYAYATARGLEQYAARFKGVPARYLTPEEKELRGINQAIRREALTRSIVSELQSEINRHVHTSYTYEPRGLNPEGLMVTASYVPVRLSGFPQSFSRIIGSRTFIMKVRHFVGYKPTAIHLIRRYRGWGHTRHNCSVEYAPMSTLLYDEPVRLSLPIVNLSTY